MKNLVKRKTMVRILLCVIWLGLIFYNGTRQGEISQRSSKKIINAASEFVKPSLNKLEKTGLKFSDVNFYVRKNAHFFEYLISSIFLCSLIREFKMYKGNEIFLLLFLLLFFPVIDEFIQKYIPGRSSSVLDIMIDFSGGILGMLIFNIRCKIHKKKVAV